MEHTHHSPADWAGFYREHWEKRAVSRDHTFAGIDTSLTPAMFAAVSKAARQWKAGDKSAKFCLWVDGEKQEAFDHLLPEPTDASFLAYNERVRQAIGGREYTLLLAEPHTFEPAVWSRCQDITRNFLQFTGLPNGWLDTAIFLGSYRTTPFGVHQGPMSVLTLPLIGRKRFRLWSPDYVNKNPSLVNAMSFDDHLTDSYALAAEPGGYIYWPSREWHVAEADREDFTAALSIGIWCNPADHHPLYAMVKLLEQVLAAQPDPELEICDKPFVPGGFVEPELPPSLEYYTRRLEAYVSSGALRTEMMGMLVKTYSAYGFKVVPHDVAAPTLAPDEELVRVRNQLIVLSPATSGTLVAGANGRAFSVTDTPYTRHFFTLLEHGERPFTPSSLIAACASHAAEEVPDGAAILAMLEHLLLAGCVRRAA
jgi:hypothetical protein